jgi:hypothetical protein
MSTGCGWCRTWLSGGWGVDEIFIKLLLQLLKLYNVCLPFLLQIGASPSAYYLAYLLQFNLSKYLVMVQMNLIVVTCISSGVCFKAL